MPNDPMLAAAVAAFESAARSFEAARVLLAEIVNRDVDVDEVVEPVGCTHRDAVEVSTLGDGAPVWVCPDCGDELS